MTYALQKHKSEEDKRATTNVQMVWSFSFYSLLFSFLIFELKQQ